MSWLSRLRCRRCSDTTMASERRLAPIIESHPGANVDDAGLNKGDDKARHSADPQEGAEQRYWQCGYQNDGQRGQKGLPSRPDSSGLRLARSGLERGRTGAIDAAGLHAPRRSASSANPPTTMSVAGFGTGSGGPAGPHSAGRWTNAVR